MLANETTDAAKLEQLTLCLRCPDGNAAREDFWRLVDVAVLSGKGSVKIDLQFLSDLKANMEGSVGQGHDGAVIVSGRLNGAQATTS